MDMDQQKPQLEPAQPRRRWRRAAVATTVLGGMLFSGFTVLPTAVMNSAHRDNLLNERFAEYGVKATSGAASGSWVTPVSMQNVVFEDETGQVKVSIREVRTSRTILGLMTNGGDLGTITLIEPKIQIRLDDDGKLPPKLQQKGDSFRDPTKDKPAFAVEIQNAEFVLSVPWRPLPIVDLDQINVSAAVTNETDGRFLTVQPVQLLDHEPLSELHTEQNLAMIAPVLSQSTELDGEVSVRLDGLRMQLDDAENSQMLIAGEAVFHSVESRLKKEWVSQISKLAGHLTGTSVPDRLQIVRDSRVAFQVDDHGIHHQGLVFLLPEIAQYMSIESSGMVGLDESLDLSLNIQLPQLAPKNPMLAAFSKLVRLPFMLSVKGTVSEPVLVTPPGFSMVDQLAENLNPGGASQPPAVSRAVMDLIGLVSQPEGDETSDSVVGGILNIIRSAKATQKDTDAGAEFKAPKEKRPRKQRRRRQL